MSVPTQLENVRAAVATVTASGLLAPLTAHMLFNAANLVIFFINGDPPARLPVASRAAWGASRHRRLGTPS